MFRKFPSIERMRHVPKQNGLWVISEKIHGANMGVYLSWSEEGWKVNFASRTQMLDPSNYSRFFNLHVIAQDLEDKASQLQRLLARENLPVSELVVYGELHGGSYPHKDVPKDNQSRAVQGKCFYSPKLSFKAFDVAFPGAEDKTDHLTYQDRMLLVEQVFDVPRRWVGKVENLLRLLPSIYEQGPGVDKGLPPIEGNIMEGVVLRPWNFHGQDPVKVINPAYEASTSKRTSVETMLEREPDPDYSHLITDCKIDSAVSKLGTPCRQMIGAVIKEVSIDILSENPYLDTRALNKQVARAIKNDERFQ